MPLWANDSLAGVARLPRRQSWIPTPFFGILPPMQPEDKAGQDGERARRPGMRILAEFMALKYAQLVAHAVGEERMQTPRDSALQRQMKTAAQDNVTSLTVLIDELRSVGIPVVFANLGIPAESPLAGIGKAAGASSASVHLELKEIIPDGHPDKRGHARIAEQVADVLAGNTPVQGPPIPANALCQRR